MRHFSLYEFAFKPRVELVLRSDPVLNTKYNAEMGSLDEMEEVDEAEAANMKAFLGGHDEEFHSQKSAGNLMDGHST